MKIRQVRNATILLTYGDKTFLIDPFLAEKGVDFHPELSRIGG